MTTQEKINTLPKDLKKLINVMIETKTYQKTLLVQDHKSKKWKRFLKDLKPARDMKLLRLNTIMPDLNRIKLSLGPDVLDMIKY